MTEKEMKLFRNDVGFLVGGPACVRMICNDHGITFECEPRDNYPPYLIGRGRTAMHAINSLLSQMGKQAEETVGGSPEVA